MKILDCTMRDGGYYTDWNFSDDFVRGLVSSLVGHVDAVELGYKSTANGGPWRVCNDGFVEKVISSIPGHESLEYAFMIDAKEFLTEDGLGLKVNLNRLWQCIKNANKSPFSICRIAVAPGEEELRIVPKLVDTIRLLGYEVIINIMQSHKMLEDTVLAERVSTCISESKVETAYIADSFGSILPNQVPFLMDVLRGSCQTVGVHFHDNMGLAFANCLSALDHMPDAIVDTTVTGMGRGVGNAKTEQLLTFLNQEHGLHSFIAKHMTEKKWGYSESYMISGKRAIHPNYVLNIQEKGYTGDDLESRLRKVDHGSSTLDYDLVDAIEQKEATVAVVIPARYESSRFPGKPLVDICGLPMVVRVAKQCYPAVGSQNVYVATDSKEIATELERHGVKFIMTSNECITGTDRVAEAALEIDADIIVNVQGDEPMIDHIDILSAIELKKKNMNSVINCAAPLVADENPESRNIPKMAVSQNGDLLYASRALVPQNKAGDNSKVLKQICIYAFTKQELELYSSKSKEALEEIEDIEILRFLERGVSVKVVEVLGGSLAVDTPDDADLVRKALGEGESS